MAATDRFAKSQGPWPAEQLSDPVSSAAAITPSDSTPLTQIPKAIYVGVTGDITMQLKSDSASVLFKAVPVGVLPVRPLQVFATGTGATNILALY
jgi:hypothetical protein